jgi:hypothetical protein
MGYSGDVMYAATTGASRLIESGKAFASLWSVAGACPQSTHSNQEAALSV